MISQPLGFGVLLRRWRERRRLTQTDLAFAANSSTRHLSFLETGRSQPSREIILRLAECLDVPLREQNALLLAAGFAAIYQERSLADLASAKLAIDQVLQAHAPYPAFALDRHWNVVLSNSALPQLYEGCSPSFLTKPVNAARLILHPLAMGPRIVNFSEWREHTVAVLHQQIAACADPEIEALLTEVRAYPVPADSAGPTTIEGPRRFATPLQIATRLGTVSFLNTTTVFGTPTDITLSELALEMLFPANQRTVEIVKAMSEESKRASLVGSQVESVG
jgi:transcriptional regulator with XRE-family HTH domain